MSIKAGVGVSHNRNAKQAGEEAVNRAFENAEIKNAHFLFMFATVAYNQEELLKSVNKTSKNTPLCGCSGEGIITQMEADESNFAIAVMAIKSDKLKFINGITKGLKDNPVNIGEKIAKSIQPEIKADTLALFLFPDSFTLNFDKLLSGLEKKFNLDSFLPVLGGTAGDNFSFKQTYQYYNNQVMSDSVSWLLLSGDAHIAWTVNHGCIPIGIEHKITHCEKNIIYEIDGKPALEVLKDYLSEEYFQDWDRAVQTFPLGFKLSEDISTDYDQYTIRAIIRGKDNKKGLIVIPTEVSEGMSIWITRRDYEKLKNGIEKAGDIIKSKLKNNGAKIVFQFDCAGRGKSFLREREKLDLLNMLHEKIGNNVPWLGFYSFGEISPIGEINYFHNFSMVLIAIY